MSEKTQENLSYAFAAESKASARNIAFALKAQEEGYPQLAKLFRAIADGEATHARRYLFSMRGKIGTSQENLKEAHRNEHAAAAEFQRLVKEAGEDGPPQVKKAFSHARDVDKENADLLGKAMEDMLVSDTTDYYVCQICGHISEDSPPKNCPICHAVQTRFKRVD
jgi:rubrerythrin